MMITKNQIRIIKSLEQKKFRNETGLFVAEGKKIVNEMQTSALKIHSLYASQQYLSSVSNLPYPCNEVNEPELKKISFLTTPNEVLCLVEIPKHEIDFPKVSDKLSIFLDRIQDPGNMGNIIRIADWFGIENIFCSPECADAYNPKVVQASMGSIVRVNIHCSKIENIIAGIRKTSSAYPVYAAVLDGKNIYAEPLTKNGLFIVGNESTGISTEVLPFANKKISIPRFGKADSLNVAASAAVICSEFAKRSH